jgi:Na+-translocating membrane potential-generating system (MpsC)
MNYGTLESYDSGAIVVCYSPEPGLPAMRPDALEVTMRTQGEIEASISQGVSRFEQEYMGRGPKDIRAHLIDDLLVVRLQGVLTAAERHLVKSLTAEKGKTCSSKYGPI